MPAPVEVSARFCVEPQRQTVTRRVAHVASSVANDVLAPVARVGVRLAVAAALLYTAGCGPLNPGVDGGSGNNGGVGTSQGSGTDGGTGTNGDLTQQLIACHDKAGEALKKWAEAHPGEPAAGGYNVPGGYYPTLEDCEKTVYSSGSSTSTS